LYYEFKNYLLEQYDEKLKIVKNTDNVNPNTITQWKLNALDKFMAECGDATLYTATVSQYFTIPELIALKRFMYKHDTRRILQMAHQRYDQTGLEQWKHDPKWTKYCEVCKSMEALSPALTISS
ncbi:MAG: radical SAM protein, partial [Patescibacteria group bacterium]|nr:radical SAM protein [Patescibacteria group bacterium]